MTDDAPEAGGPGKVAIVGMAARFPGAADLDEFWRNLRDGVESIEVLADERLLAAGVQAEDLDDPAYVRVAPRFDGIDRFDAGFFGCSPREAAAMDPQHRIFLELAWSALEDAGYGAPQDLDRVGVFGGASTSAYLENVITNLDRGAAIRGENPGLGFELAFLASRVSYKLDLRGPSVPVQTACSTALVAVHYACQTLLGYESDMAVCGAVAYKVRPDVGYRYLEGSFLSPDGHVRPFDADARGTVFGNGAGVLVLKRLEDALANGDTVHAVIGGSAVNNDGAGRASFTAPSVAGQAAVVAEAMAAAEVTPEDIDYVEAHGTGTVIGDSIEVQALCRAFSGRGSCAIGSVKGNIGHLDAAAGMAGLLKTVLALKNETLPATLNFRSPNPDIDPDGPFRVQSGQSRWPRDPDRVRRAGVSAFGFGGTNAHVILEEAPVMPVAESAEPPHVLVVSARSPEALAEAADRLADHLELHRPDLGDAAHTLALGRKAFTHRRAITVIENDPAAAGKALRACDPKSVVAGEVPAGGAPIVFLFTGQGAQHPGMGHDLYLAESVYRDSVDLCAESLNPLLGLDVRDVLVKPNDELNETRYAQPALFVTGYALAQLWKSWGIAPTVMLGHSLGEWIAAAVAGVVSLADALTLVTHRAVLMQQQPPGAMLNVIAERGDLQLPPELVLAAHNSPRDCVVSGPAEDIAAYADAVGWTTQPLTTSHAFHHPTMQPAADALYRHLTTTTLHPPATPIISCITAKPLTEATDPHYWSSQLVTTVEFVQAVHSIAATPNPVFLEIGPGNTLTTLTRRTLGASATTIASLPHRRDKRGAAETMRQALAKMWTTGAEPRWTAQFDGRRKRVPLPSYPFQRKHFWLDMPGDEPPAPVSGVHPLLDRVLLRSAGQSVFLTEFALDRHWVLSEHRLLGEAIVPGTTYLEMARAAASHHLGRPVTGIRDVTFLVPLLVREGERRTVHTTVRDTLDGAGAEFSIASHVPATDQWTTHALGVIDTAQLPQQSHVDVAALRDRCAAESVDVGTDQAGHEVMAFGERWVHSLRTVHVGDRAALGELTLPDRYRAECDEHVLHPALLDLATGFTAFALARDAADRERARAERGFFLPVGYDEVLVHGPLPARGFSLIEARADAALDGEVRTVDVMVCGEDGTPAITVRGFTTKRVADPDRTVARLRPHGRHHALRWVATLDGPGAPRPLGRVLVVAERGGSGAALADRLRVGGAEVVFAEFGDAWRRDGEDRFLIPPTEVGFADLLDALSDRTPSHVVHVAAGRCAHDVPARRLETGVHALFKLVQALSDRGVVPVGLAVVAPVVSRVTGREGMPSAVHAALFGLASVVAAEQDTEVRCVDVEEGADPDAVVAELVGDRLPVTVALREGVRYVRELGALDLKGEPRTDPSAADGVFLISGGLGGLGLAVARRLARTVSGARLALLSRTAPGGDDPRSRARDEALRELAELGAEVRVYAVDVVDAAAVADVVKQVREELGRVECVIHAAGVAGDGFLFRKDEATFRRTFDPKVLGVLALAEATADDPPAVTVLFSSTVAVFGAAGQGDYAAANAFLDGFAEELVARGRSVVSVAWTDWLDTGMAFEHGVTRDRGFFRSVAVEDGLDSLEEVLASRCARVVVGEINHARLGDPDIADLLRRSPVVLSAQLRRGVEEARLGDLDAPRANGPELFGRDDGNYSDTERALAVIWAAELGIDQLNVHDSAFALGVDSLSALRIAQHIHKALDVRVSMADLFRHVTLADLAAHLEQLDGTR